VNLRELGATGVMVPEVGLGTWKYAGGVAPLQRGMDLGAFLIDTAEVYRTEDVVGQAIKGRRNEVFVATKVSGDNLRYEQILRAAEGSLKRLGIETIDLYQVHWPDNNVPISHTMRAMEELVEAGKVRYIGVSNFDRSEVEEAQAALRHERIVANQVEYSLLQRFIELDLDFYQQNQITVIAYSPLARGLLVSSRSNRRGLDELQAVAAEAGKTVAQIAINWCLSRPGVITIPKSDRVDRTEENVASSGWYLTPEQVARLDRAFSS
jgi:diketogulonate reductase-like aldo/keto reductase